MEIELLQDAADQIGRFSLLVYGIKGTLRSVHCQRWNVNDLGFGRNGGDPRSDAETYCLQPTQLPYQGIGLLAVRSLWVEDRFSIVEDYEHLPRR